MRYLYALRFEVQRGIAFYRPRSLAKELNMWGVDESNVAYRWKTDKMTLVTQAALGWLLR